MTSRRRQLIDAHLSSSSPAYFIDNVCSCFDPYANTHGGAWVPFKLWPAQATVLGDLDAHQLLAILKARQLGLSWLVVGFALWAMLFRAAFPVLLFSRRDDEAIDLLARLRGMLEHLAPGPWKATRMVTSSADKLTLDNGSSATAFPTTAGDSYTASLVVIDEADLVPDLAGLLGRTQPTIDGGGKLVLISRPDKKDVNSPFKRIYRAARAGGSGWYPVFLPWYARPDRTRAWYEARKAEIQATTGSLDDLHERYPQSEAEALGPRSQGKRFPTAWLDHCFTEARALLSHLLPAAAALPSKLEVFVRPQPGRRYVIGADTAEGNPTSCDSALEVLDTESGEEVAALADKLEPALLAQAVKRVSAWYHSAPALVERNNHGHAVLLALKSLGVRRLCGHDGKEGWMSSERGKVMLYDTAADALRTADTRIHSLATYAQLASIDGDNLQPPGSGGSDRAIAFVLAVQARLKAPRSAGGPDLEQDPAGRSAVDMMPRGVWLT